MVEAIYHSFEDGSLPQASKTSQDVESWDTRNREDDQIKKKVFLIDAKLQFVCAKVIWVATKTTPF